MNQASFVLIAACSVKRKAAWYYSGNSHVINGCVMLSESETSQIIAMGNSRNDQRLKAWPRPEPCVAASLRSE
jgi:hypothetical protein